MPVFPANCASGLPARNPVNFRFRFLHEFSLVGGELDSLASSIDETIVGGRRSLRTPDTALEPEDAAVYLWRA